MPYAALVGAHDRDNFGDLAYSAIIAKILQPLPVLRLGMLSRDMQPFGGGVVVAASALKRTVARFERATAVIFFGGETLACDVRSTLAMNLAPDHARAFCRMTPQTQARVVRATTMAQAASIGYVLHPDDLYPRPNSDVPFVYHSVGGTTLASLARQPDVLQVVQANLRRANSVSVRDNETRALLSRLLGLDVALVPDSCFALRRVLGDEIDRISGCRAVATARAAGPYIVFQSNEKALTSIGLPRIARLLGKLACQAKATIVLQPAGTAFAHDSMSQLASLATCIRTNDPHIRTQLQTDRHFLVQAATIANAACWIGTSLHGRIAAIATRVPAVSLVNPKVSAMVRTWEPDPPFLPYDVTCDHLIDAVQYALRAALSEREALAARLEQTAMSGLQALRALAVKNVPCPEVREDLGLDQVVVRSLIEENRHLREENFRLVKDLSTPADANQDLQAILRSRSWRYTAPLRAISRFLRVLMPCTDRR
jgi:hypothetical protein